MSERVTRLAIVAALVAVAVALRRQLVDALTRTTGTWVGSPEPPQAEGRQ